MLTNLLSLLGINKLWIYAGVIIAALATITGAYYLWKSSIEQRALMEFNIIQLEQSIKNQEEHRRRQEVLEEQQREAARLLADQNRLLNTRVQSIQRVLNSPETAANDRPASDILKQTIDQLREIK